MRKVARVGKLSLQFGGVKMSPSTTTTTSNSRNSSGCEGFITAMIWRSVTSINESPGSGTASRGQKE